MNKIINKTVFNYCQKSFRDSDSGKLKVTASLTWLVNHYEVGYIEDGYFYYDAKDKKHLLQRVALDLNGVHLFRDSYPQLQTRNQIAKHHRKEKIGALKVSEDFVLINSLGTINLNQQVTPLTGLTSLGQFICASEIQSIEHQQIVLVENLIVMANLARLNITNELKGALWIYRGDIKAQQKISCAYQLFRRFKATHQLICFSDVDPSGLQISLTSGASDFLTLENVNDLEIELQGHETEWFKQHSAIKYLTNELTLSEHCKALFLKMKQSQKTLKQEHLVAHSIPLTVYSLTG